MAEDFVYRFRTDGLDELTVKIRRMEAEFLASTQSSAALAKSLGLTFGEAQKLAQGIGLSASQMSKAVGLLQQLGASGASTQQRFDALNKGLGVTAQQFLALDKAVVTQAEAQARLKTQTEQAAQAQKNQAESNRQLAAAQKQQQAEAEKIFQTNARLTAQQVKAELAAQAQAEKELAAAEKARQAEAEKIFQTNAKLSQQQVKQALKEQTDATKALAQAEKEASQQRQQALQGLATASTAVTGAIGGVFAKGAKDFLAFDNAIRQAGAIGESSGTPQLKALANEVERLGVVTSKTPAEIAQVTVDLTKAGFSATETKQALQGIVLASEATGEALQTVGDIVAKTIRQFGLAASDSERVADVLVATANATNTDVKGLGESLKFIGPTARASNQSLEDVSVLLGLLGDNALQGGQGGRNLAQALSRLNVASAETSPEIEDLVRGSKKMREAFQLLQVDIRNTDGTLKPLPESLGGIKASLKNFNPGEQAVILKALFGEEGGRAVGAILQSSAERIAFVTAKVKESQNAAREASGELLKGLGGSLKLLEGSAGAAGQTLGAELAPALEGIVREATDVINAFLRLPAPVQGSLIAVTGFVGILAGAIALTTAFKIADETLGISLGISTAATEAKTVATNLLAVALGTATEAQTAANASFLAGATQAGLLAGAIAAIGLNVDTFAKIGAASADTEAAAKSLADSIRGISEAQIAAGATAQQTANFEAQSLDKIRDRLGLLQRGLDFIRQINFSNLIAQVAKISALPGPVRELLTKISELLPRAATAEEAAVNNSKVAFSDLLTNTDTVVGQVQTALAKLRSGQKLTGDELVALSNALDNANTQLKNGNPLTEADIAQKKIYAKAIADAKKELEGYTKAGEDDAKAAARRPTQKPDDPKEETKERKAEVKKEAKDDGEDLKQQRQTAKLKEEADFADAQREKQEQEQDRVAKADREYQKAKELRAEAFQNQQAAIDKQNQKEKEERAALFQAQEAAIDKQNQEEKQKREADFNEAQRKIEEDRKEAQRKRDEGQKQSQDDAGRLLTGEVARGKDLRKLREDQFQRDSLGKLTDEDLLGKEGKGLSAQELAALAKRTAGLGPGQLQGKDSEEAAQNALKLITDRQNKALKEQERKEDEAAAKKKREEELKFKLTQEKIDADKAKQKKERERQEKDKEEKEDDRKAREKKKRERDEKEKEEGLDLKHEEAKKKEARKFAADLRDDERDFKEKQRKDDLDNAEKIKAIIESAKVKAPEPESKPAPKNVGSNPIGDINYVPRFTGGSVSPGTTYSANERGPELVQREGTLQWLGDGRPGFFRFNRPGTIIPAHRTQALLNQLTQTRLSVMAPAIHASFGMGEGAVGSNDAVVKELQALRRQVNEMRPINQQYDITTQSPMDEVYKATKMAARIRR